MIRLLTCLMFLSSFQHFVGTGVSPSNQYKIVVSSQKDFDSLSSSVAKACAAYNNVLVEFSDGVYYFNDTNELKLVKLSSEVTLKGSEKAYFVSDGETYSVGEAVGKVSGHYKVRLKSPVSADMVFIDGKMKAVPLADSGWMNEDLHTNIVNVPIELADSKNGIAKIVIPDELSSLKNKKQDYFKNSRICYKAQWTDCYRQILYSDNKYIYFDLSEHLVNKFSDYVGSMYSWIVKNSADGKGYVPFFVTNLKEVASADAVYYDDQFIYIPENVSSLHVCKFNKFLSIDECKGQINLYGMNFCGSSSGDQLITYNDIPGSYRMALVRFFKSSSLLVSHCSFRLMGGGSVHMYRSDALVMEDNSFTDNYTDMAAHFSGDNKTFVFRRNFINNPDKIITHINCLYFDKVANVEISSNTAVNVSRGFIKCGRGENVIVTSNEVYNTEAFNRYKVRNTSSDTGAFVYAHQNCPMLISNNIVHDLSSNYRFNGVYVDSGTGNVVIKNNLFYNVEENAVYCRRVASVSNSGHGNVLEGNIILGNSVFAGSDVKTKDNASFGGNYLPGTILETISKSRTSDKGGNTALSGWRVDSDAVRIPESAYRKIQSDRSFNDTIKSRINKL